MYVSICRQIFIAYEVGKEIGSDGGPQFKAIEFTSFLKDWGVRHRLSSVDYPQSNGRAELGVKTAKRILAGNTSPNGSLDNDKVAKALLQYRNTPLPEIGLSPAQLLLHRQLRDSIPANPKLYLPNKSWVISADEREKAFSLRNKQVKEKYDQGSRSLNPITVGTHVRVQNGKRWDKTGCVVESLPNGQY